MSVPVDVALEGARDALARHEWARAYEALAALPSVDDLAKECDRLEMLAEAAWWTSRLDECIAARERAYARAADEGDAPRAARLALFLFDDQCFKGRRAVASGWLQRARRALDSTPETVTHGYLELKFAETAHGNGAFDDALDHAGRALEIGRRYGDRDLEADALQCTGRLLIEHGAPDDGLALYDEAMLLAVDGSLGPFTTGKVYCSLISACDELGDVRRAAEWTEVGAHWSASHPFAVFPGLCRVHRAELMQLRGAWAEAEAEARRATVELCDVNLLNTGMAYYAIAEVRRRLGDHPEAAAAFARAEEHGCSAQPGEALLQLAMGDADRAQVSIQRALSECEGRRLAQAKLLPAHVEIAIVRGDIATASAASRELESIAAKYASPGLRAAAVMAHGRVALAEGAADEACRALRRALHEWQALDVPYEVGVTRVLLGCASRAAGDDHGALASFDAAIAIFQRLGAAADAQRALRDRAGGVGLPCGLTAREVEVLEQVAVGSTNKQIAVALHLSEKTVARHLSNIFAKIGVTSRSAATAFAFEHHLTSRRAAPADGSNHPRA